LPTAYAEAWFARGWALEKSGNETAAIVDYGRAIDAKPGHAMALFSRGFLNLYGGNPHDAVADFVRTQGVAKDESLRLYSHLWLYLSRVRADQNAQERLKSDTAQASLAQWPGPLILHFLGNMNESAVLTFIEQGTAGSRTPRHGILSWAFPRRYPATKTAPGRILKNPGYRRGRLPHAAGRELKTPLEVTQ
jgi:lipoprotein NlpI